MIDFFKILVVGRLLLVCLCSALVRLTAWDRDGGRASTCTASKIMIGYIIFAVVVVKIMIMIGVIFVKEGWLNKVLLSTGK